LFLLSLEVNDGSRRPMQKSKQQYKSRRQKLITLPNEKGRQEGDSSRKKTKKKPSKHKMTRDGLEETNTFLQLSMVTANHHGYFLVLNYMIFM